MKGLNVDTGSGARCDVVAAQRTTGYTRDPVVALSAVVSLRDSMTTGEDVSVPLTRCNFEQVMRKNCGSIWHTVAHACEVISD